MKSDALSLNNFLGCAIADLRKTFGFTQKDFAKIINVSDSSLAHYEQGISFPSIDTLIRIADYFHVNVDYLLGRSENRPEYRKMNEKLYQDMTIGKMVNIVSSFNPKGKKYLYDSILLLMKAEEYKKSP